jgi:twitching motility protein PilT
VSSVSPELRDALERLVHLRGSDLHLGDDDPPMGRINGDLRPLPDTLATNQSVLSLVRGLVDPDQISQLDASGGGAIDFAFSIAGVGRFRANLYMAGRGWALAVRLLAEHVPTLAELQLPRSLASLVEAKTGLVLFTGPTGSGKSATMAALVSHITEHRRVHVITLEDPIEVIHPRKRGLVRQRELGRHTATFADGLRAALREDPDIILVGEMRDQETIQLALTAAETGHLVLSTLHSSRAYAAVDRIVDVFDEHKQGQARAQLADSLQAVVAQRLVKRADGQGRVAAVEVMRINHAIANLIRERRAQQIPSVMQTHRDDGMWLLERHLAALARKGLITVEEAYAHADDQSLVETYLGT